MKKPVNKKRLVLDREQLRVLDDAHLVRGAAVNKSITFCADSACETISTYP